ncbi:chemotaxis protein CheA [Vitiosangium sp. GDMCC 1.1324]|uniref:chemotaxis protein CheA n=1 Tax=Vitiosangium sp. (strain GDMCC 1.1324) TaxID=2138576 RepID=UPI000D3D7C33|nr:chemotaxis protein CheA [Vitiosangium sp. GDMCC 1.1324]PTL82935.1 chemotaxis protein CheA [Vitiosangium sp. GDMCC 1.1324]
MTMDMSRYLGLFLTEASEHLEGLGRDLVQLEREGAPAVVDSMFRHAHSVKGMASSMGFEPIAVLAHRVEDLVDAIRQDPSRLERTLVDLLLSATDVMMAQVRAVADSKPPDDASALLGQLADRVCVLTGRTPGATRVLNRAPPSPPPAPAVAARVAADVLVSLETSEAPPPASAAEARVAAVVPEASSPASAQLAATVAAVVSAPKVEGEAKAEGAPKTPTRWAVRLRIAATCQTPGVRAFLVHKRLTNLGSLHDLQPPLEDLKAGRIPEGHIQLELETAEGEDAIRKALRNIAEVELASLKSAVVAPPPAPASVAASSAPAEAARQSPAGADATRTVRVRTELLDYFLDTVGELLLATARLRELGKVLPEGSRPPIEEGVYRLHTLVKDLHDKVMSARMTPLSLITDRLPRAARDIARRREREVDLVITGAEIELDRAILDELADPLLHLLRNCIDHGLEPAEERVAAGKGARGRVLVSVRRARDRVVLEMEDDGRGMNAAKLKAAAVARGAISAEAAARMTDREAFLLSCLPGVSTAKDVSEISGRGVGMDAVKRVVENVGGTLEIESELGRGTRFTLRLPLTVAVVHLLLVAVGDEVFGLPIAKVVGAMEADGEALDRSREMPLLPHGQGLLPVYALDELVGVEAPPRKGVRPFVVMEGDAGRVALAVDRLVGQEEAVLKPLSRPLDLLPGLSGVTILGSGRPVFILDVPRLLSA